MATHSWIIERENVFVREDRTARQTAYPVDLPAICRAARECVEAFRGEQARDGTGRCYPENSDHWGTLAVNAASLARALTDRAPAVASELARLVELIRGD